MKYGIIYFKSTPNFGDDILSVAASRLLPHTDYQIDIDHLDTFHAEEPVAAVMSLWFLRMKWNWPPARSIIPLFAGFHYSDHKQEIFRSPVSYEFLSGPGLQALKAAEPIGCRDLPTCEALRSLGLDAYFSGCITLTLSDIPVYSGPREYICLVDVPAKVEEKIRSELDGANVDILTFTHSISDSEELTWSQRAERVLERLSIYHGAKCVVSNRLHATLPCLAMETPVLTISNKLEVERFSPYKDWFYGCSPKTFLEEGIDYNFLDPPPNPTAYLPYREKMLETVKAFVERTKDLTADEIEEFPYSEDAILRWRHDLMKDALSRWIPIQREYSTENKQLKRKVRRANRGLRERAVRVDALETTLAGLQKQLDNKEWKIKDLEMTMAGLQDRLDNRDQKIKDLKTTMAELKDRLDDKDRKIKDLKTTLTEVRGHLKDKNRQLKEKKSENKALKKELSYRLVRWALKLHALLQRIRGHVS